MTIFILLILATIAALAIYFSNKDLKKQVNEIKIPPPQVETNEEKLEKSVLDSQEETTHKISVPEAVVFTKIVPTAHFSDGLESTSADHSKKSTGEKKSKKNKGATTSKPVKKVKETKSPAKKLGVKKSGRPKKNPGDQLLLS